MARAVVLVSGSLDSATVLAIAQAEGWTCHALSVDYGQCHRAELAAAARVARALGDASHRVVSVGLGGVGGSGLTGPAIGVPRPPTAVPSDGSAVNSTDPAIASIASRAELRLSPSRG